MFNRVRAGKEVTLPVLSSSNIAVLWTTQASLPPSQVRETLTIVWQLGVAIAITLYIDKAKRKTPLTEDISYLLLQLLSCFPWKLTSWSNVHIPNHHLHLTPDWLLCLQLLSQFYSSLLFHVLAFKLSHSYLPSASTGSRWEVGDKGQVEHFNDQVHSVLTTGHMY